MSRAQRKLSSITDKRSKDYKKQRTIVAKIHERIRNQRSNFSHQLSKQIVDKYKFIAVEDLNVKGMMESGKTWVKSIADASWTQFLSQLEYKAESAGRTFVKVNPRGTSQRCYRCQTVVPKDLSVRWHNCPKCLLSMDRDENSALEIKRLGLQSLEVQRSTFLPRSPGL